MGRYTYKGEEYEQVIPPKVTERHISGKQPQSHGNCCEAQEHSENGNVFVAGGFLRVAQSLGLVLRSFNSQRRHLGIRLLELPFDLSSGFSRDRNGMGMGVGVGSEVRTKGGGRFHNNSLSASRVVHAATMHTPACVLNSSSAHMQAWSVAAQEELDMAATRHSDYHNEPSMLVVHPDSAFCDYQVPRLFPDLNKKRSLTAQLGSWTAARTTEAC